MHATDTNLPITLFVFILNFLNYVPPPSSFVVFSRSEVDQPTRTLLIATQLKATKTAAAAATSQQKTAP